MEAVVTIFAVNVCKIIPTKIKDVIIAQLMVYSFSPEVNHATIADPIAHAKYLLKA